MRNSRITIPLLSLAAVLLISGYVFGVSSYTTSFNTTYGAAAGTALGANSSANCILCHPNGDTGSYTSYADAFRNSGQSSTVNKFRAIEPLDSDGDGFSNLAEITALTNPSNAASHPTTGGDATLPVVSVFTIPTSSTSLAVPITALTATDNVGVTGYLVNESATKPAAGNWAAAPPASYTFATAGAKTLYAWARDAAGNVSNVLSPGRSVTITAGGSEVDVESPEVMEFTLPLTSTSLTVSILAFRAIDNIDATAYLITTTPAAPAANAAGWSATPRTSYTFTSGGAKTLYGWARDAAGNISESLWDNVDIIADSDQIPPVVTSFRVPSTSRTFAVTIRRFTATDNTAVAGYLVTTASTKPGSSDPKWSSTPPTGFTFTSTGRKRLYPWAKDAAGNVSSTYRHATVMVLGNNQEEEEEDEEDD